MAISRASNYLHGQRRTVGLSGGMRVLHSRARFEQWLPALFDGEFDWDFILPAFRGTKITPMDIDCCIERKNHFLMFETKNNGQSISLGQKITLTNLWRNGKATVVHLQGKTPREITACAMYSEWEKDKNCEVGSRELKAVTAADVLFIVRRWYCRVDGQPKPTRAEWDRDLWTMDHDGLIPFNRITV